MSAMQEPEHGTQATVCSMRREQPVCKPQTPRANELESTLNDGLVHEPDVALLSNAANAGELLDVASRWQREGPRHA
jgi:hypothetical protein